MTSNRIPQAHNHHHLALGTDLDTGEAVTLDLDQHPHLLTAGWTGGGVSSLLCRLAAQALVDGTTVTVIDPKQTSFENLDGLPGLTIGRSPAEIAEEIRLFHAEMMRRHTSGEQGPRRLLVADELTQMRARINGGGHAELDAAVRLLRPIVLAGHSVGCHLALDADLEALRWFGLGDRDVLNKVATVVMGRPSRQLLSRLGIDPALISAERGTGVLRLPGDKGRRLAIGYLADAELRALALGVIHS
ncbi:FtsK/SpoIIIE domain-containing protein [Streptomyces sp. NPDC086989]|uniref:FtsK/SpoIIIE domain-containing protein n=1 Tax=Streptomyces sp. NPDC086989 TaxID=3365764 RepID=UPI0037F314D0